MTLLKILGILLIALLIAIPLLERFGKTHSDEEVSSLTRWILPLAAMLVIVQMFLYWSD